MRTLKDVFKTYGKKLEVLQERQKKVFMNFVNSKLLEFNRPEIKKISDMSSGIDFYYLIRCFSKKDTSFLRRAVITDKKREHNEIIKLNNASIILSFLEKEENLNLDGINPVMLSKGDDKIIQALLWQLITKYQLRGKGSKPLEKHFVKYMKWVNSRLPQSCKIHSIEQWKTGKALYHLINSLMSKLTDKEKGDGKEEDGEVEKRLVIQDVDKKKPKEVIEECMEYAYEELGIPKLLDSDDFINDPDELSLMTYVSYFKNYSRRDKEEFKKKRRRKKRKRKKIAEGGEDLVKKKKKRRRKKKKKKAEGEAEGKTKRRRKKKKPKKKKKKKLEETPAELAITEEKGQERTKETESEQVSLVKQSQAYEKELGEEREKRSESEEKYSKPSSMRTHHGMIEEEREKEIGEKDSIHEKEVEEKEKEEVARESSSEKGKSEKEEMSGSGKDEKLEDKEERVEKEERIHDRESAEREKEREKEEIEQEITERDGKEKQVEQEVVKEKKTEVVEEKEKEFAEEKEKEIIEEKEKEVAEQKEKEVVELVDPVLEKEKELPKEIKGEVVEEKEKEVVEEREVEEKAAVEEKENELVEEKGRRVVEEQEKEVEEKAVEVVQETSETEKELDHPKKVDPEVVVSKEVPKEQTSEIAQPVIVTKTDKIEEESGEVDDYVTDESDYEISGSSEEDDGESDDEFELSDEENSGDEEDEKIAAIESKREKEFQTRQKEVVVEEKGAVEEEKPEVPKKLIKGTPKRTQSMSLRKKIVFNDPDRKDKQIIEKRGELQLLQKAPGHLRVSDFYKIVSVGDFGVGKSSILKRFCFDEYEGKSELNAGGNLLKYLPFNNTLISEDDEDAAKTEFKDPVYFNLGDTAGEEKFLSLSNQYFRDAAGLIVQYDVHDRKSLTSCKKWLEFALRHTRDGCVILLLGNKRDKARPTLLQDDIMDLIREYALSNTMLNFEVSAKTNIKKSVHTSIIDFLEIVHFKFNQAEVFKPQQSSSSLRRQTIIVPKEIKTGGFYHKKGCCAGGMY